MHFMKFLMRFDELVARSISGIITFSLEDIPLGIYAKNLKIYG